MFFHLQPQGRAPARTNGSQPLSLVVDPGGIRGSEVLPNNPDWFGRFRRTVNAASGYDMTRAKQRSMAEYSSVAGIDMQGQMVTESMGPVYDRRQEHPGTSDRMVIRTCRRLRAADAPRPRRRRPALGGQAKAYRERGRRCVGSPTAPTESRPPGTFAPRSSTPSSTLP